MFQSFGVTVLLTQWLRRTPAEFPTMRLASAVVALAFASALVPVSSLAQSTAPSWLGVTLDTPAADLRPTLGDPLRVTRLPDALGSAAPTPGPDVQPQRKARYLLSATPPVFLIVSERHGAVVGIQAFSDQSLSGETSGVAPDPSGVVLGATEQAVLKAHPGARRSETPDGGQLFAAVGSRYVASYDLVGGRVSAIDWFARASTDPQGADGPALAEPAGDSPATAILDVGTTEEAGIRWQRVWQLFHPCDGKTAWVKAGVATSRQNGRMYDAIRLTCPTTGATRIVYFDITSFFGKL